VVNIRYTDVIYSTSLC